MENKDCTSTIHIDEWARELENKASYETERQVRYENSTIFKVSENLRSVQSEAYEPMIVSLGPYHCHKPHLQVTNQPKWLLLHKLQERDSEKSLRNYLKLVKEEETEVRNTYSEPPTDMCEKTFIEMMLLDCVFVIMILWFWKKDKRGMKELEKPIFKNRQRSWRILARDMLLLENQLPFFLLEALFNSAFPDKHGRLKKWVVLFFSGFVNDRMPEVPKDDTKTIHHILHLFYLCIVPSNRSSKVVFVRPTIRNYQRMGRVQTATQLEATGIKLERKRNGMSFLDITFEKGKGVLEIPLIIIDDDTNILLRNLIALEQCQKSINCYEISTYAWVLSCITCTVNDVERLQQEGIIIDRLSNTNEVVNLFSKLCKEVEVGHINCYISKVFKEVEKYRPMD